MVWFLKANKNHFLNKTIHIIFITALCITFIGSNSGVSVKKSGLSDADAKELSGLLLKLWSLKPPILKRIDPLLSCELAEKCCKGENPVKVVSSLKGQQSEATVGTADYVIKMCVNSSSASKIDRACSAVIKSRLPDKTV